MCVRACVWRCVISLQLLREQFGWNERKEVLRRRQSGRRFSEGGSPEKTITHKSTKVLLGKREKTGLDDEKELILGILCEVKGEKKV